MDIQKTQLYNNKFLWTLSFIIITADLLFAYFGLFEFYNVKIAEMQSIYPFGPINENPCYYQNSSIYGSYNLTSGLIF